MFLTFGQALSLLYTLSEKLQEVFGLLVPGDALGLDTLDNAGY